MFFPEAREYAQRAAKRFPVYFVWLLLAGPSLMFLYFVSVDRILARGDILHFLFQITLLVALFVAAGISFVGAIARRPLRPDATLAPPDARPLRPDDPPRHPGHRLGSSRPDPGQGGRHLDDDDIPLRILRDSPRPPVPLAPLATGFEPSASASYLHTPNPSHDGGVSGEGGVSGVSRALGMAEEGAEGEDAALLPKTDEDEESTHAPLMAKSGTGGPRWCRKCDAWKPDRTHHCRSCRQCVLKMDHHCPWLDNCVGYHNQKSFVLFTTYACLLALYGGIEAAHETYRLFNDPPPDIAPGPEAAQQWDEWEEIHYAFKPVALLLITIMGIAFGLAVGGLAGYHWFLVLNNRTTLEDMNRLPPAALLDPDTRARLEQLGERGSRRRTPGAWRPDHILTRNERTKLRDEARSINVYDVGWRANVRSVMIGDGAPPPSTWRQVARYAAAGANPLAPLQRRGHGAGHFFPHDAGTLERLRSLTREMRVGLGDDEGGREADGVRERNDEVYTGGEWTLGDDSGSDSERTVYDETYGDRRRGRFDV